MSPATVGVEDVARNVHDLAEHRVEIERRRQLASDLEDSSQCFRLGNQGAQLLAGSVIGMRT